MRKYIAIFLVIVFAIVLFDIFVTVQSIVIAVRE
jgi:hypothetical protein